MEKTHRNNLVILSLKLTNFDLFNHSSRILTTPPAEAFTNSK